MFFSLVRSSSVRKSACLNACWFSSENQSPRCNLVPRAFSLTWALAPPPSQGKGPGNEVGLDGQCKAHVFTCIPAAMLVENKTPAIWPLHTGICKFEQNISTNIQSLGKRRDLKIGQVLFFYLPNIAISWLYSLNSQFSIYFFVPWQWKRSIHKKGKNWRSFLLEIIQLISTLQ